MTVRVLFSILALFVGTEVFAQNLDNLIKEGDSLLKIKENSKAYLFYTNLVQNILSDKIKASELEWKVVIKNAALASQIASNKNSIIAYNNMLYGSKSESIKEKIDYLFDVGEKFVYTFYPFYNSGVSPGVVFNGCTASQTKYLFWYGRGKWYIQGFNECDTYKPLSFSDSQLDELFLQSSAKIAQDTIVPLKVNNSHSQKYYVDFFDIGVVRKSIKIDAADITIHPKESLQYKELMRRKLLEASEHNVQSSIAKVIVRSTKILGMYRDALNSSKERQLVGSSIEK